MRKICFTLAALFFAATGFAQNTGINTTTPASTFEVNGSEALKTKTNNNSGSALYYPDATATIYIYIINGSISLPAASSCPHRLYTLVNKTSAAMPFNGLSYLNMSNNQVFGLNAYSTITIVSEDGTWQQIR